MNESLAPSIHLRRRKKRRIDGVLIGQIVGVHGQVSVRAPHRDTPLPARTAVAVNASHVGSKVVLSFEDGDPTKPIIMGILQQSPANTVHATLNGEKLLLTSDKEVTLRCGDASVTLTRAGKVIIKGHYVVSRSTGVNRIKGGVVQIN